MSRVSLRSAVAPRIDGRRQAACPGAAPIRRGSSTTIPAATWSVQVAPDKERAKAGSAPTPDEAQAALAGYIAYFGTYSVDEQAAHRHAPSPGQRAARRRRRPRARLRVRGRPADPAAARHDLRSRVGTDQVRRRQRRGSGHGRVDAAARRDRGGRQDHEWFKSAGDAVKPGDNLFEIETDKVSMEVPSTTTGVLAEIRVAAGEVAPVGAIVAVIADGAGAATAAQPPSAAPAQARHRRNGARIAARLACTAPPCAAGAGGRRGPARSVLRGAHARAQLRPGAACRAAPW